MATVLVCLLGIKTCISYKENTSYPLVIDYDTAYKHKKDNSLKKVNFALRDRINNSCTNPLFFCEPQVHLGMTKEEFKKGNVTENAIFLNNQLIPCATVYKFNADEKLCAVYARISNDVFKSVPDIVLSTLGDKRVDVLSEFDSSKHIWYYPEYYIHLDKSFFSASKTVYLTVCTYSSNSIHSPYELFFSGGGYDYIFDEASKAQSSSSTKAYKYGDSDIYQGSSKQAEDLAAIDAYFGF